LTIWWNEIGAKSPLATALTRAVSEPKAAVAGFGIDSWGISLYYSAMFRATLAILALTLLPACSGCRACGEILCFFFSGGDSELSDKWDEQNDIFQGYENDRKEREESSKAWSASALP